MNNNSIEISELMPIINEVISSGGEFQLYPRGTSMLPLIKEGETFVNLVLPDELKKNDVVLYLRKSGQYVLHRIIKIKNSLFYLCGDNQFRLEKEIEKSQIIAKVISFGNNGCVFGPSDKKYSKYVKKLKFKRFVKRLKYSICVLLKKNNAHI